jgi:hypothetical protein
VYAVSCDILLLTKEGPPFDHLLCDSLTKTDEASSFTSFLLSNPSSSDKNETLDLLDQFVYTKILRPTTIFGWYSWQVAFGGIHGPKPCNRTALSASSSKSGRVK